MIIFNRMHDREESRYVKKKICGCRIYFVFSPAKKNKLCAYRPMLSAMTVTEIIQCSFAQKMHLLARIEAHI